MNRSTKSETRSGTGWTTGGGGGDSVLQRRFPTLAALEQQAKSRTPRFVFDFVQGGAGDESGLARNRAALDAICMVPRYGIDVSTIDTATKVLGQSFNLPVGVSPIGLAGLGWPGADQLFARMAQAGRVPYVLSTSASLAIERAAQLAPDVFWYQLYGAPDNDHELSFDLLHRARVAGAQTLVVTLDIPVRAKRLRDIRNRFMLPFKLRPKTLLDIARAPRWALATWLHGEPMLENFRAYVAADADAATLAGFVFQKMVGSLTWDQVKRFRDAWPRSFVVKGILHPDDAEQAIAIGAEAVMVSNHGGRQFDAAPAPVAVLPQVVRQVAGRAAIMVDGGVRSGLDIARYLALGADLVFAGRGFLYGAMALGELGPAHVLDIYRQELLTTLGQVGARNLREAREITLQ